ncbi:methyltransferase domain-containing protein [Chitinophaga rhizophila]|uniref:Methyltransferase domain-containing protein n=1 Tax=Chitinophaga rhizophila TaxID=2866212 RepID=A0ABS7G8H0_9BACT|nr:methyltransferase domain-containing protein [Chitinophaga rhizophila]MBW8683963.1 methyltransferase domain-containing protein [Chitinophaga rhizophila]
MSWNADLYREKHAFVFDYGNSLIEWLQPAAGETILDLGCGTGELTAQIAEKGAKVTGIDSAASMIESAQQHFPGVDFRVADATAFSLEEKFDAVFSNATLHWVRQQEKALDRIYNHLKPGGRFVLEMGGKGNVDDITGALEKAMQNRGYQYKPFWYFPSVGEYTSLLEEYGFRVNQVHYFDRDTELADPENGIVQWLQMFGSHFLEQVPEEDRQPILQEAQESLRATNFRDGKWYTKYVRLRVKAEKLSTDL